MRPILRANGQDTEGAAWATDEPQDNSQAAVAAHDDQQHGYGDTDEADKLHDPQRQRARLVSRTGHATRR